MMGRQRKIQRKLFYSIINLDKRVRKDHILRKVVKYIDFDFTYKEVKDKYGIKGNVSVPPPVILKMLLLLILYNVRSERELMSTIPERLDWLWFLGYDLDDDIPNHSVLSKARTRWDVEAFKTFFENIVWQCVQAGLVDGSKLFMGSSVVDADASVTRRGKGKSKLRYQIHRGVDEKCEVITATEATPGEVHESHRMQSLIDKHQENTGRTVETAVADSKYGTIENYLSCNDREIKAHFNSLEHSQKGTGTKKGIFPKEVFIYDADNDIFICPAGQTLKRRKYFKKRKHYEYIAPASTCSSCQLRERCTRSKSGRTLKRHVRQDDLDFMLKQADSRESQKDIRTRQHLMERSFARGTRYGYQRARWRRLWRVEIKEYMTAGILNMIVLFRNIKEPKVAAAIAQAKSATKSACYSIQQQFSYFKEGITDRMKYFLPNKWLELQI